MSLSVRRLQIPDVLLITPRRFADNRGYFVETWSKAAFEGVGINADFVQDNQSSSTSAGTVRGLHFQSAPFEQAKLVRVLRGSIFDVAVDLRPASPSFGRWCTAELSSDGGEQLFLPRGFAHGLLTLEPETVVAYKVDAPYSREHEGGIRWDDTTLDIPWPSVVGQPVISQKDLKLPLLKDINASGERP